MGLYKVRLLKIKKNDISRRIWRIIMEIILGVWKNEFTLTIGRLRTRTRDVLINFNKVKSFKSSWTLRVDYFSALIVNNKRCPARIN